MDIYIYLYGIFIHTVFIINYIINIYESKSKNLNIAIFTFILGHITIIVNLIRHILSHGNENNLVFDDQLTIAGITGHGFLSASILMQIFIFRNMKLDFMRIIFLLGQLGMIMLYKYVYELDKYKEIHINKFRLLYILVPCLIIFYTKEFFIANNNITKIIFLMMTMVYINWVIFILYLTKNKKYTFLN